MFFAAEHALPLHDSESVRAGLERHRDVREPALSGILTNAFRGFEQTDRLLNQHRIGKRPRVEVPRDSLEVGRQRVTLQLARPFGIVEHLVDRWQHDARIDEGGAAETASHEHADVRIDAEIEQRGAPAETPESCVSLDLADCLGK